MLLIPNRFWRRASTQTQVAGERCRRDVRHSWGRWEVGVGLGKGFLGPLHLSLTLTLFP